MDGSEDNPGPRSRRLPVILATLAPALASTGLAPAGLVEPVDLLWVSPTCAAGAAGIYGLFGWLRNRELSFRFELERRQAGGVSLSVNAKFNELLGEEEAQNPNLAEMHALPDGTQDPVLILVQRLLHVPEVEWEDAQADIWRFAADRKTRPYSRVVIASGLATRNITKGVMLLVRIARDGELASMVRLMAIHELRRWDLDVAAMEYECLNADERISAEDRIVAGELLGELDAERGAAALLAIVQNPKLHFDDRFNAAERSGQFSDWARERALWALATDSTQRMTNRVSASGRLHQLGVPGARELLESGAENLSLEPEARELCMKFLAEVQPFS
ncbi:hypothetical protein SAMN05216270_108206 [Glycomyces harbinensis]|uniref:Uncharacterized protein n=2 Tax=Glycomyces harbinensis TaxID=58114 RepID=A0A1G6YAZ0_9ACTN|nr:hypothetical protein [Glycomyces harbinensis]SDD86897.1 hypothetical protein SAMN05216270_108206 [Glycomyces harbinensis]